LEKILNKRVFSAIAHAEAMRKGGFWIDRLFDDYLKENIQSVPNKLAVIADSADGQRRFTWSELGDKVGSASAALRHMGLRRGDIIAMQTPTWWEAVVTTLACARLGLVLNPLMTIFREHELTYMLGFAEAKAFIVPKRFGNFDFETMANALQSQLPCIKHVIVMRGDGPNSFDRQVLDRNEHLDAASPTEKPRPDELSVLMYTSGTTGSPKGVMHTANTLLCGINSFAARSNLTSNDIILIGAPLGHMIGLANMLLAVRLATTMVLQEAWNGTRALELTLAENVTFCTGATPYLSDLCDAAGQSKQKPSTLRLFLCAGAPIPPTLIDRAAAELDLRVTSAWGMTETLANTMTEPERAFEKSSKTDGRPLEGSEVKVVDEQGKLVSAGTVGRLFVRGAQLMLGYYRRPEMEPFDAEGWLDTGDLAFMDEEGYIRIAGRTKDLIIRGGENIPVVDIENVLLEHPALLAVALVGYPDTRLGERVCAFAQLRPGQQFDVRTMQGHMEAKKVAKQFWPEKLVIVETLPRTPSGKIQKFALRQMARDHEAPRSAADRD
jgi:cyclohexanecarboxylate-CoA ligase